MKLRSLAPVLLLGVASGAHAWNEAGHMTIAAIAEMHLQPAVRAEAMRLLKVGSTERAYDFVTAGPWADDIRSQNPKSGPWHYINYHFRTDGKRTTMKPEPENAVVAIERFRATLADRSKPDAERADALRFLIHLVGDLHQPMHSTARDTDAHPEGDRGGNEFKIGIADQFRDMERPPNNLHSLWDLGAGVFAARESRPLNPEGLNRIRVTASALVAALPASGFRAVTNLNPEVWARESHEDAKKVAYALPDNSAPTAAYLAKAREVSVRRATLAGYRLAALLNSTVK